MSLRPGARRLRAPAETAKSDHPHGSLHGAPVGLLPGVVLPPAHAAPAPQPAPVAPVGNEFARKAAQTVVDATQDTFVLAGCRARCST